MRAYAALCAQAEQIGWPLIFRNDLVVHDASECASLRPGDCFLWILQETGTHLIHATESLDPMKVELCVCSLDKHLGPSRFFWWDGSELAEMADAEEACFVLEDKLAEQRPRAAGAA
jgi:hypothetical protein